MNPAIIVGIVVLFGGVIGVMLYLQGKKRKEAERKRREEQERKRKEEEAKRELKRENEKAEAEAKTQRRIKAMKAESDAKLARLARDVQRREGERQRERTMRARKDEERDMQRRRAREREEKEYQERTRRRQEQERRRENEYQERTRRRREQERRRENEWKARQRAESEREQRMMAKRREREAAERARRAAAQSPKAVGRPVGNRVGKTNRGVKRFGKIGHIAKHSRSDGQTPAQRAQIARMSPQRRRILKVCVRNRRNRGTHRDEALRLCLPRGHKKKYGVKIGGLARAAKNAARKAAGRRAQVKNCARAKERAFVKAQMGARRIGGGRMRRMFRMPSRVQRMNWMRDCEANPTSSGNFRFGRTGRFKKAGRVSKF